MMQHLERAAKRLWSERARAYRQFDKNPLKLSLQTHAWLGDTAAIAAKSVV